LRLFLGLRAQLRVMDQGWVQKPNALLGPQLGPQTQEELKHSSLPLTQENALIGICPTT